MTIQLSIMTKLNDDMLQIVEQILPYFQPTYNLPINFLGDFKEKRDIPIQLEGISMEDDYEGNFETRRALVYTLTFTSSKHFSLVLCPMYQAILSRRLLLVMCLVPQDQVSEIQKETSHTESYQELVQDYDDSYVTTIAENVDEIEKVIEVVDASQLSATYIQIGKEEMYIEKVSGNKLTVKRGQDTSTVSEHVLGSWSCTITTSDDTVH